MSNILRNIPSVNELLDSPPLKSLMNRVSQNTVVTGVRQFLDEMRSQMQTATAGMHVPTAPELAQRIADWMANDRHPVLQTVINATGTLLHARLGGPPLADEAIAAMTTAAQGYANFEFELSSEETLPREAFVERKLAQLTSAEAATVVSSIAGARLLAIAALASGREVIVSRGDLSELGDGSRVGDLVSTGGAKLREVGSVNRTRAADYEAALGESTGAILRVSSRNYELLGSCEELPLRELVAVARRQNLPIIVDLERGSLIERAKLGLPAAPLVSEAVATGADLVLVRGDGLVGGPACCLIAGRRERVDRVTKHPLMQALRIGKESLAALAATLRLYADPELAERSIPLLSLLSTPLENLRQRAERLAPQIAAAGIAAVEVEVGKADIGGCGLPTDFLPTIRLALSPRTGTASELAAQLRNATPAVVGRVEQDRVVLDLKSVRPREDLQLMAAIESLRPKSEPISEPMISMPD